jgi:dTMP kinase
VFDMKVEDGLKRSGRRLAAEESAEDRFEQLDIVFHERMRQGYLSIAGNEPQRCVVVDATGSTQEIAAQLMQEVGKRL